MPKDLKSPGTLAPAETTIAEKFALTPLRGGDDEDSKLYSRD
jgi:hypothetical protein